MIVTIFSMLSMALAMVLSASITRKGHRYHAQLDNAGMVSSVLIRAEEVMAGGGADFSIKCGAAHCSHDVYRLCETK